MAAVGPLQADASLASFRQAQPFFLKHFPDFHFMIPTVAGTSVRQWLWLLFSVSWAEEK